MCNRRLILNFFITSTLITLCAFGSCVYAYSGSVIIGLLHKHKLEKQSLDNALNDRLITIDWKYDGEIYSLNFKSLKDIQVLNKNHNEMQESLVKENGLKKTYPSLKKDLDTLLKDKKANISKKLRSDTYEVNLIRKKEKDKITQGFRPKFDEIKKIQYVELNMLKEIHKENTNQVNLKHLTENNRLSEAINKEYNSLRSNQKTEKENFYSDRKQQLIGAEKLGKERKNHIYKIQGVEKSSLSSKHNNEIIIFKSIKNERGNILERMQHRERKALGIIHNTELRGGTYQEYIAMVAVLSDIGILLSYDPELNEVNSVTGEKSLQSSEEVRLNSKIERSFASLPLLPDYLYGTGGVSEAISTTWMDLNSKILGTENLQEQYDDFYTSASEYRLMAELELITARRLLKERDMLAAQRHIDNFERYQKQFMMASEAANVAYLGDIDASKILAQAVYDGSKAAVKYGSYFLPYPEAPRIVDTLFKATDFYIETTDVGMQEASKSLATDILVDALMNVPLETQGGKSISQAIKNGTTKQIGSSGLYNLLDEAFHSPKYEAEVMRFIAKSSAVAVDETLKNQLSELVTAMRNSNINNTGVMY